MYKQNKVLLTFKFLGLPCTVLYWNYPDINAERDTKRFEYELADFHGHAVFMQLLSNYGLRRRPGRARKLDDASSTATDHHLARVDEWSTCHHRLQLSGSIKNSKEIHILLPYNHIMSNLILICDEQIYGQGYLMEGRKALATLR